jgi:hypothetical protein
VLLLLGNAGRLYRNAVGEQRKWLNQAVFATIAIDLTGDDPHPTQETLTVEMTGELAEPVAAVAGLAQLGANGRKGRDEATHSPTEDENRHPEGQNRTSGQLSLAGGFNLTNLAGSLRNSICHILARSSGRAFTVNPLAMSGKSSRALLRRCHPVSDRGRTSTPFGAPRSTVGTASKRRDRRPQTSARHTPRSPSTNLI